MNAARKWCVIRAIEELETKNNRFNHCHVMSGPDPALSGIGIAVDCGLALRN